MKIRLLTKKGISWRNVLRVTPVCRPPIKNAEFYQDEGINGMKSSRPGLSVY